jgi:hypothetical protein
MKNWFVTPENQICQLWTGNCALRQLAITSSKLRKTYGDLIAKPKEMTPHVEYDDRGCCWEEGTNVLRDYDLCAAMQYSVCLVVPSPDAPRKVGGKGNVIQDFQLNQAMNIFERLSGVVSVTN